MDIAPYIWAIVGILLIGSEFLVPGFIVFFFGAGALITGAITGIFPGLRSEVPLQLVLWVVSSLVSLLGLRRYSSSWLRGFSWKSAGAEDVAGKTGTVVEPISPGAPGRIKFQGTTWQAESYGESFEQGDSVIILRSDNLTMIVTKPYQ